MEQPITVSDAGIYRIKIQGKLSAGALRRFDNLAADVAYNAAGIPFTTLTGPVTDQASLHGILASVRDLGLPLIVVELIGHE